jgi:hypothetical protein
VMAGMFLVACIVKTASRPRAAWRTSRIALPSGCSVADRDAMLYYRAEPPPVRVRRGARVASPSHLGAAWPTSGIGLPSGRGVADEWHRPNEKEWGLHTFPPLCF